MRRMRKYHLEDNTWSDVSGWWLALGFVVVALSGGVLVVGAWGLARLLGRLLGRLL